MPKKNIHICYLDKFIPGFIELVRDEIDERDDFFYLIGDHERYPYQDGRDTKYQRSKVGFIKLYFELRKYEKIILHGLFNKYVVILLALQPSLLKRCYWFIWGGDLYSYKEVRKTLKKKFLEHCRRRVIKGIGHLVTYIPGDVELAREWYKASGKHIDCLMYRSNVYKKLNLPGRIGKDNKLTVLIGNSASPSNNHADAFNKLAELGYDDIKIICPLSYGNKSYSDSVISKGKRMFGNDFIALTEFLDFDEYLGLLSDVDIAIFPHHRQQAMGNIITLLGLGKKVYIRKSITPWSMFEEKGIKVFDYNSLSLVRIDDNFAQSNSELIEVNFSKDRLVKELKSFL